MLHLRENLNADDPTNAPAIAGKQLSGTDFLEFVAIAHFSAPC